MNNEGSLDEAIALLYETFAGYTLHEHVQGCPCCVSESDIKLITDKPLRALSGDDLGRYAFKAITTFGNDADFKHFLPRLFELLIEDGLREDGLDVRAEIVFGKLEYAKWDTWPQNEQEAITAYFCASWREALASSLQMTVAYEWLRAIAQAVDDLKPYLDIWQDTQTASALGQLLELIDDNRDDLKQRRALKDVFWSGRESQMRQVADWLLDSETAQRFLNICASCLSALR